MLTRATASPAVLNTRRNDASFLGYFAAIIAITFLLRIWYVGNLYQDDGLWFTAAEEMLRGKALYREIFFDKPPALPLLYAALFRLFGAHIITIRLFTICYSILVSSLLYLFGSRLYEKRAGLLAGLMFAVFSTTYVSGDMQSLNTDFLMAPLYIAGAFLLIQSCAARRRPERLAFAGGLMSGIAFHINPKGAFDLIFFAVLLIVARSWHDGPLLTYTRRALKLFALAVAGLAVASLPFIDYLFATDSMSRYVLYVWEWGLRYSSYYSSARGAEIFLHYSTDYFLINNTLLIGLLVVVGIIVRRTVSHRNQVAAESLVFFNTDVALLLWFAVSFAGVAAGGRFFAHYYFQIIPSLCLIGSRGLFAILSWSKSRDGFVRVVVLILLVGGFGYTLVRTHSETAELAVDWMRGRRSSINPETRLAAAIVRDIPDASDAVDRLTTEGLRAGGPRTRAADGAADFLFVWGNWPEVYYLSGLLPASGYLSSQPLTGLPADVWYGSEEYRLLLDDNATAAARVELLNELEQTPPKFIIDELGFRDPRFSITSYPELLELLSNYERLNPGARVPIYILRSQRSR
jgi:4-amino-4-deoxy-L-arabinose transferase-like glycosyltransferase